MHRNGNCSVIITPPFFSEPVARLGDLAHASMVSTLPSAAIDKLTATIIWRRENGLADLDGGESTQGEGGGLNAELVKEEGRCGKEWVSLIFDHLTAVNDLTPTQLIKTAMSTVGTRWDGLFIIKYLLETNRQTRPSTSSTACGSWRGLSGTISVSRQGSSAYYCPRSIDR